MNNSPKEDEQEKLIEFDEQESNDLDQEIVDLKEPFDPKEIDIQVQQTTMDNLIKRLKHGEIDPYPDFQRTANLWKPQAKSRLIESLLIRLPLPAFYFDASDDNKWQVVDGLQRLSTIMDFIVDKKMKLKGMEFVNECEGLRYDELHKTLQRRIDEAPVTLYLIKPGTPVNVKYSLFYRINTGGLTLNGQEIRHALSQSVNHAQASHFLMKLSKSDIFKTCVRVSDRRMLDKELVLRYIGFKLNDYREYKEPMIKHLNDTMEKLGKSDKETLDRLEKEFYNTLELCWELFDEDAFRKSIINPEARKMLNRALFEVLVTQLSELPYHCLEKVRSNKNGFVSDFKILLESPEFMQAITTSTTYSDNIKFRFKKISELIQRYDH